MFTRTSGRTPADANALRAQRLRAQFQRCAAAGVNAVRAKALAAQGQRCGAAKAGGRGLPRPGR